MKYWFRGIEKFAPWARKIHFVTWGHVPDFLNINHPRLHIVNHKEFIPSGCLPMYNANVIEVSLHKINDLAERFIYFNDDVFLLKTTRKEDFFCDGLPKSNAIECPIFQEGAYGSLLKNDIDAAVLPLLGNKDASSEIIAPLRKHKNTALSDLGEFDLKQLQLYCDELNMVSTKAVDNKILHSFSLEGWLLLVSLSDLISEFKSKEYSFESIKLLKGINLINSNI
jgi:hypothetical protein